jgi:hypothetical protein
VWWLTLAPGGLAASLLIGQTAPSDPASTFAQYGVLGVAVLALAVFARQAYNRERDRADRLEKELKESRDRELAMQVKVSEEFAPLVVRATDALSRRRARE